MLSVAMAMELASRSYLLECRRSSTDTKSQWYDEISTQYLVQVSLDDGVLTEWKDVASFGGYEGNQLFHFISELDYSDSHGPTIKRTISSESGESVEELDRPLSEPFSFTMHYSDHSSSKVKCLYTEICTGVAERLLCLQQLVELCLVECPLTEEAACFLQFGPLYNMKVLKLEKLSLRRLHPSVGRLRMLRDLSLCYNRLTDLPLTIRLLRNLRCLDITGNPFRRLPGAVYHLHLDSISGLNECPLSKHCGGPSHSRDGWQITNQDICWRKPLGVAEPRESVASLQECCVQAAVGLDCWQLELPERYTQRLSKMAETQGLCENCLKSVRKLTVEHESLGYTIHAQVAMFCGVRDVPFSFIVCSLSCLEVTTSKLVRVNEAGKKVKEFSRLPHCEYGLKFVQDLEEYRRQRALSSLPVPRPTQNRRSESNCLLS